MKTKQKITNFLTGALVATALVGCGEKEGILKKK